jgi:hypothetical protein
VKKLYWLGMAVCLFAGGCDKYTGKKPDPTKGVVTGVVLCADTGKPARFATVTLSAAPKKDVKAEPGEPLPATESAVTDLEGRFRIEAIEPGRYYAFATLDGYLDLEHSIDLARLEGLASDHERNLDAIAQWKDHLVEVSVRVHRTAEAKLEVERGAEIGGTVTFDDGSPAIGMHFQLFRQTEKKSWTGVGVPLMDSWSIHTVSDGHGRYNLSNLPAGEYVVCALLPASTQDVAARVCLGNVFRRKDAKTLKVSAGEALTGVNIEIPLSGLHSVAGTVTGLADGHAVGHGSVRLLYGDDREKAREVPLSDDGSFAFPYVPEGNYILQVTGARQAEEKDAEAGGAEVPSYMDKEITLKVLGDLSDVQVQLAHKPTGQAPRL